MGWFGNRHVREYADDVWGIIQYRNAEQGGWDWIVERDDETLAHGRTKTLQAAKRACDAAWRRLSTKPRDK